MKGLCRTIGKVLNKPCWLSIPALALRLGLGRMVGQTLLCSQRVLPQRLLKAGFKFARPKIEDALNEILRKG